MFLLEGCDVMHLNIIEISHMAQAYDELQIFEEAFLKVRSFDRIGLIGDNGTGKTTLVKIIMGEVPVDKGQVFVDPECRIGYLKQVNEQTVEEEVAYETLSKIGVSDYKQIDDERLNHLSGGERTKYQLGRLFEGSYDLIILDEPTNHLDQRGRQWLIDQLDSFYGGVIIISHDRWFLDEVTDQIVEVRQHKLNLYEGNYSAYVQQRDHERYSHEQAYLRQEKRKAALDREIRQFKDWAEKGHRESTKKTDKSGVKMGLKEKYRARAKKKDNQVKNKIKQFEKVDLDGVEKPDELTDIRFRFGGAGHKSRKVLSAEGLGKAFGDRVLFDQGHFYLFRGERVGLIGDNGSGKSTLIKMIRGLDKDYSGYLHTNDGQKVAYISQDILDMVTNVTVIEALGLYDRHRQSEGRRILAQMGIGKEKVLKPIGQLSMGERTRIKIAGIILDEVDFLILDEPTNHLDLRTKETLEQALSQYDGTILLCSHDRYMIERICEKLLVIEGGKIRMVDRSPKNYYNGSNTLVVDDDRTLTLKKMLLENRAAMILGELSGYAEGSEPYLEAELRYQAIQVEIKNLEV